MVRLARGAARARHVSRHEGGAPGLRRVRESVREYGGSRAALAPPPDAAPERAPDPWAEAEDLAGLEEEIAVLAAHLHAGEHRLLVRLAEYDRRRGWELGGHRSCAHWLAFRTGIDLGAARERVRAARALTGLPATSAAMGRGELSFSAVRALTRVATPENEEDLLELARGCTAATIERIVRGWRLGRREDEVARERARHESRELSVFPDADGMLVVRGRLAPEVGALLMRAIEAAADALYRERGPCGSPGGVSAEAWHLEAARRRADALALVAERALAAGFGGDGTSGTPLSGTRAARYQVVLHVDADTLARDGGLGRSELEDGTRVSAETSRRVACDASLVPVRRGRDGSVLDVGRRSRTVPPALRCALEARDRGCRFPGCGLRYTDAHHVRHWADGGETSLGNLVLLCAHHHRLVHEGGWKLEWWAGGRPAFVDPRGQMHVGGRPPSPLVPGGGDPVRALVAENRRAGVEPDLLTAGARWKREADVPDRVWRRAREALG